MEGEAPCLFVEHDTEGLIFFCINVCLKNEFSTNLKSSSSPNVKQTSSNNELLIILFFNASFNSFSSLYFSLLLEHSQTKVKGVNISCAGCLLK